MSARCFRTISQASLTWSLSWVFAKILQDQWAEVATHLGGVGLDDLVIISLIEAVEYKAAAEAMKANAIFKVKLNLFVNLVRKVKGLEPEDIFAQVAAAATRATEPQAQAPIVVTVQKDEPDDALPP